MKINEFSNYRRALPSFMKLVDKTSELDERKLLQVYIGHFSDVVANLINAKPWECDVNLHIIADANHLEALTTEVEKQKDTVHFTKIYSVPNLAQRENFIVSNYGFYDELGYDSNRLRIGFDETGRHYMIDFYKSIFREAAIQYADYYFDDLHTAYKAAA